MPKVNLEEMRKLDIALLEERVIQLRVDLARLRAATERGTVKKEDGKIRPTRRNIARLSTILNQKKKEN